MSGIEIRIDGGPRQQPMRPVWTVERPRGRGVLIDDLKESEEEALAEVARRGPPWTTARIYVTVP